MWTKPPPEWKEKRRKASLSFWIVILLVYFFIVIGIMWATLNLPLPSDLSFAIFIMAFAVFSIIYFVIVSRIVALRWFLKDETR